MSSDSGRQDSGWSATTAVMRLVPLHLYKSALQSMGESIPRSSFSKRS